MKLKTYLKKIGKYSILLSIKESYLFSRNIFGLIVHPYKTLRAIFREQDYSQVILVLGLPFIILFFGLFIIKFGRLLIQAPPDWGILAKLILFFSLLLTLYSLLFLVYWLIKIINLQKRKI